MEWNPNQVHFSQDVGDGSGDFGLGIASYDTRHQRPDVESSYLAKQWGIGLETATETLRATTQACLTCHPPPEQEIPDGQHDSEASKTACYFLF